MNIKRFVSVFIIYCLLLALLGGFSASSSNSLLYIDRDSAIPEYITDEAERVASAIKATREEESFVFPVMTDFHLYAENSKHDASLRSAQYAGMGINELGKLVDIDFVGYLGDYTWGSNKYEADQVIKDIKAVRNATVTKNKDIWCVGNHDLNYGANRDRLLTNEELYSYIGSNSYGVKPDESRERCYGYLDFESQKMRVIYLNTCDASDWENIEGVDARSEWISPTQIQWLVDEGLCFDDKESPAEWGIVIVGHHPLHYAFDCFSKVMVILEAYRDGLSGSVACIKNSKKADDGTEKYNIKRVNYDFSSKERAEIICNIHGHSHNCAASKISSTTIYGSDAVEPWLWRLCIPNICANRYNTGYENFKNIDGGKKYGELDKNGNAVYWTKEEETANATSFCVVNINRESKKIYTHIFGAGKDRVFSYDDADITLMNNTSGIELIDVYSEKMHMGDVTGDGRINMLDIFMMRRYILGFETQTQRFTVDTDGNGKLNILDLFNVKLIVKGVKPAIKLNNTTVKKAFDKNEDALRLSVTDVGETDAFFDINVSNMDLSTYKYLTIVWKGSSKAEVGFVDRNHNTKYSANVENAVGDEYGYAIAEIVKNADNCKRIEVKYSCERAGDELFIDSVIFASNMEDAKAAADQRLSRRNAVLMD